MKRLPILLIAVVCSGAAGGCEDARQAEQAAARQIPPELHAERGPQETAELVALGQAAFEANACTTCHTPAGDTSHGPPLAGIYQQPVQLADGREVERDAAYLYRSLVAPSLEPVEGYHPQLMPDYRHLDTETLVALVEYIKSLTPAEGDGGSTTASTDAQASSR